MTKDELLQHLADVGSADALEIANVFGLTHAAAAMALLRLTRQGRAHRYADADGGLYFYELSDRGHDRLAFFQTSS
jgi:hypothetical protein